MQKNTKNMRVIYDGKYNGALNMAIDEMLLHSSILSDDTILRFYGWESKTFSFGRTMDIEKIKKDLGAGVGLVRRPTGGGIVTHFNDYTFSFCSRFSNNSLRETYYEIHNIIKKAFEKFKVNNIIINEKFYEKDKSKYCFELPVKYDLIYENKKIVGGAQTISKNYFLYQGTMYLENFKFNINEFLKTVVCFFAQKYSLEVILNNISDKEMKTANKLSKKKYKNKNWLYYGICSI